MTDRPLRISRDQVVAFRRGAGGLDERRTWGPHSLRAAAWAGLQDSLPRAALLSIHARIHATTADGLDDPSLVQLWGPRFSAYVVADCDRAVFTLGRLPDDPRRRREAHQLADRLETLLDGRRMKYGDAGRALGMHPNKLRRAAVTGRLVIHWDGARPPTIWTVPSPEADPADARLELARRHLRVFGPTTAQAFGDWAGIHQMRAGATFEALVPSLTPVTTPAGEAWILTDDEEVLRNSVQRSVAAARLIPSGDAFFLLQEPDRQLLVPDEQRRQALWTTRVWPGAVVVGGEVAGTWRRAGATVTVDAWRPLSTAEREAVESEARSFPLSDPPGTIRVRWTA